MEVFLMINYISSITIMEMEQLNCILSNVLSGVITCIVQEMIAIAVEYTIKYIRKNAVQLLTIMPFLYTVCRIKLLNSILLAFIYVKFWISFLVENRQIALKF